MGSLYKRPDCKFWQMSWIDENGKRRRKSAGTSCKATASRILAETERQAAITAAGLRDPVSDAIQAHAKEPIAKWIEDYISSLEVTHGKENQHVEDTKVQITKVVTAANVKHGRELRSHHLTSYIKQRQKIENLSARTVQSYVVAVKGFTAWCKLHNRLVSDPFASASAPTPAKDRRYVRRALTREEWAWLCRILPDSRPKRLLAGSDRLALYELALVTGLRAKEIKSLRRSSFILEGSSPYVMLPASTTKNAKPAEQMLTPSCAARLRDLLATKMPSAPAFSINDLNHLAVCIRSDMEEARAAWIKEAGTDLDEISRRTNSDFLNSIDHEGKRIDFHALRYTCGAWLALGGIHAKQIQKVMRHSTIRLTLDTYGHLFPEQQDAAMAVLERLIRVE